MSEPVSPDQQSGGAAGPGGLHAGHALRAAREARGQTLLHLSILLKINERRLQAFEDGRWDEVGDRTFVRALAQSLCRHLEVDPRPILLALPAASVEPRQKPDRGRLPESTAPAFKTLRRPIRMPGASSGTRWITPVRLGVAVILSGALGLALAPSDWWSTSGNTAVVGGMVTTGSGPEPAAGFASGPAPQADGQAAAQIPSVASGPISAASTPEVTLPVSPTPAPVVPATGNPPTPTAGTAPPATSPAAAPATQSDTGAAALQIRATQDAWVQVTDAKGRVLLSRLMRSGERAGLEGVRPLRMRIGNVAGIEATWQGRRVALDESQRNNVAEVELP